MMAHAERISTFAASDTIVQGVWLLAVLRVVRNSLTTLSEVEYQKSSTPQFVL